MSNEEFQRLVLEKLSHLDERLKGMDTELKGLNNRLERNEQLTADLIRIVGHTNVMVEEMRADIDVMKADIDVMKADIEEIKTEQHHFAYSLGKQRVIAEGLLERFLEHDADIKTLRKALYLHD